MAESKLVSGFECEFVEKPPEIIQTECLICLLILRGPYQVICCGKSFCRSCIERVKALNNPCPHCNERNFTDFPNIGLQQSIYQLKVQCTHQNEGCKWTGELGELDNHLNLDPQPANQLKGCVYATVKCTHCSGSYQRQHIAHHQNKVCPKRPFTCEYCKDYNSNFEDITTNHWSVCGCYPVPCSNKCGAVLQRKNIESHVAKDCPLTVIKCDFHYAGCEVRLPRKDMGEHLRVELVTHTSMMAVSYQQQQDQVRQRMGELMMKNEQLEKQQMVLQIKNEALKQRVTELQREQEKDRVLIKSLYDNTPPFDVIMPNFEQHKKNKEWSSPPFYTHNRGYKLCFEVCTSNDFLSINFYMMRGEFDDELKWPFNGQVSIQLLSQDGSNEHCAITISLDNSRCFSRVTEGDIGSSGCGEWIFISFADFCKRYVNDDCLHFRIVKIITK